MEDREKEKEYVMSHNEKFGLRETIDFHKLRLIELFRDNDKFTISCTRRNLPIANIVIEETAHLGCFMQGIRYSEKIKENDKEVEYIKIPVEMIPACARLKKERKFHD